MQQHSLVCYMHAVNNEDIILNKSDFYVDKI